MRGTIIGLLSAVIISVGGLFFYSQIAEKNQINESFVDFLPANSQFVFRLSNPGDLISKKVRTGNMFSEFNTPVMELLRDSSLNLNLSPITMAFTEGMNSSTDWLMIVKKSAQNTKFVESLLDLEIKSQLGDFSIQPQGNYFIFSSEDYHVISRSENLLKSIIVQYESGNQSRCQKFISHDQAKTDDSDFDLYLTKSAFYKGLNQFSGVGKFQEQIIGDWVALDGRVKSNGVIFSGLELNPDSTSRFYQFYDLPTVKNTHVQLLPDNTYSFEWFGGENLQSWWQANEKDSVPHAVVNWFGDEFTLANIHSDGKNKKVAIVAITDTKMGIDEMADVIDSSFYFMNSKVYHFSNAFYPSEIFLLEEPVAFELVSVMGNNLVFFNEIKQLSSIIKSVDRSATLNQNEYFISFKSQTYNSSNYDVYVNWRECFQSILKGLPHNLALYFNENEDFFKNYQAWEIQVENESNSKSFISGYLRYNPGYKSVPSSVWELKLDTLTQMKPFLFENHYTHAKEVFVQDLKGQGYLISNNGKKIWQRHFNGQIIGEPQIIDWYGNDKYQLLFSTEEYLYCIDRNGKDLDGYPVKLDVKPSAGIAVFDYKKNHDYRILLPTQEGDIVNYNKSGVEVKGWAYQNSNVSFTFPLTRIEENQLDYLITGNHNGDVIALNRRGEVRLSEKELDVLISDLVVGRNLEYSYLVNLSSNHQVKTVSLRGEEELIDIPVADSILYMQSEFISLQVGNVILIQTSDSLYSFDKAGNQQGQIAWDNKIDTEINFYKFNQLNYLGLVNQKKNEINLYDINLNLFHSFPMIGASDFTITDLNGDGELEVITCSKDGYLVNYLLND